MFGSKKSKKINIPFDSALEGLDSTNRILKRADEALVGLPRNHPFKNEENHRRLLEHVKHRLFVGTELRNSLRERFRIIDQDVNGYINYDSADRKRKRDNARGKARKPTDMIIPVADAKIDELVTFLMQVFWPNDGMHNAYANYKDQAIANSFALLMNKHGEHYRHYMKVEQWFYTGMKYNIAAIYADWEETKGAKLKVDAAQGVEFEDGTIFEGNNLYNMDQYNFFFDPSVHPVDVAEHGEFAGEVKMYSSWGILKLANEGFLTNMQAAVSRGKGEQVWYQAQPTVRYDFGSSTNNNEVTDWHAWSNNRGSMTMNGNELVVGHFRVVPSDFGLSQSENMEIWRLGILNGHTIVHAENRNRAHRRLPYSIIVPRPDNLFMQKKSPAEDLLDLQGFASFLMNLHTQSSRKNLFGITVYDPNFADLKQSEGEVSAHIPTKRSVGQNGKIEDFIKQFNDSPDTGPLIEQIGKVMDILEVILPTNILKQVTDLDRATTYQAAATVQGTNRRSLKMAKVINDQGMTTLRRIMMYNIIELQPEIKIIDPRNGQEVEIVPAKLRGVDLNAMIGEGLQSIDKLMIIHLLHDVINAILQSQQASQELDIVNLLNYWTTLIGDKTDLNQFRRSKPTLDQVMQLAQTAGLIEDAKSVKAQTFAQGLQGMYGGNNQQVVAANKGNGAAPPGGVQMPPNGTLIQ